jgi:hypothetical protein
MHLNYVLLNEIKQHLHEGWVSDHYNWKDEFVNVYCTHWFYSASDCFHAIQNDATVYSNMLYFVTKHGYEYTNTVDLFNTYIYLYALYALNEEPSILQQIRNIRRIQQMRQVVPMVLNRLIHNDLVKHVIDYCGDY